MCLPQVMLYTSPCMLTTQPISCQLHLLHPTAGAMRTPNMKSLSGVSRSRGLWDSREVLCLATSTFKDIRKMCKSRTFSWRTCSSNLWYQVLKCIVWGPQCVSCNNVQNITLAVAAPVLGPNAATHLPVTSFCMEIIQNVQVINHPSISSISSIIHLPILPSINQPLTNH